MKYIDKLRNSGLRPTKQRLQICEVLFNTERTFHFTINELEQKIKDKLKDLTKKAFELNVFGAPTFLVNNKLFWGQDRLEYAIDEYKN